MKTVKEVHSDILKGLGSIPKIEFISVIILSIISLIIESLFIGLILYNVTNVNLMIWFRALMFASVFDVSLYIFYRNFKTKKFIYNVQANLKEFLNDNLNLANENDFKSTLYNYIMEKSITKKESKSMKTIAGIIYVFALTMIINFSSVININLFNSFLLSIIISVISFSIGKVISLLILKSKKTKNVLDSPEIKEKLNRKEEIYNILDKYFN